MTKRGDFAMKRTFKAIIAMILVLALGFAFSATVFAASAHAVDPQPAGIKNFFSSLIKKISDAIKNIIDRFKGDKPKPEPDTTEPAPAPEVTDAPISIDEKEYNGQNVGGDDQYAGGIW